MRVDVHVAVADAGLDDRHRRLLDHRADQPGAAARDEHVDEAAGAHEHLRGVVALARHELHGVRGQPGRRRPPRGAPRRSPRWSAGRSRSRAAATALPRLQADAGGVGGHVRAGFVDDPDHPERHPDLAQLEPVGEGRAADHLADRVGQPGHVAQPLRPSPRPAPRRGGAGRRIASGVPSARAALDVLGVGREDRPGGRPAGRRPSPAVRRPWWPGWRAASSCGRLAGAQRRRAGRRSRAVAATDMVEAYAVRRRYASPGIAGASGRARPGSERLRRHAESTIPSYWPRVARTSRSTTSSPTTSQRRQARRTRGTRSTAAAPGTATSTSVVGLVPVAISARSALNRSELRNGRCSLSRLQGAADDQRLHRRSRKRSR